jgi:hypothetical protein
MPQCGIPCSDESCAPGLMPRKSPAKAVHVLPGGRPEDGTVLYLLSGERCVPGNRA